MALLDEHAMPPPPPRPIYVRSTPSSLRLQNPSPLFSSSLDGPLSPCQSSSNSHSRSDLSIPDVSISLSALTASVNESSIRTSQIPFQPSNHGHLRRVQRNIGVRDLQAAMKHGTCVRGNPDVRSGRPRSVYTYRGIRYVVDDINGREITSYSLPMELCKRELSPEERMRHVEVQVTLQRDPSSWTSHTVLLVDKSGSMRQTDVSDSKSRLQSVWVALARDFVSLRIESGQATAYDAVSIVLVGDQPHVLVNCVPTDWALYNLIVDFYYQRCCAPSITKRLLTPNGHGNFVPALMVADNLLARTTSQSSTMLILAILSDGRPSDYNGNWASARKNILQHVEGIASKFGKRLSVHGIGMGSADKFEILREVTTVVKEYQCQGEFNVPGLSAAGLGAAFSSLASSVTESRDLVADGEVGQKMRLMRQVFREKASNVPFFTEAVDSVDFNTYMGLNVTRAVYKKDSKTFESAPLQNEDARGVSIKTVAFGEGGERLAFQFFEVASDGKTVVGEPLVAKLSRFIEEGEIDFPNIEAEADESGTRSKWAARDRFVKKFCERQNVALAIAQEFNKKLDLIKRLDPDTPRVTFLECSVYYVHNEEEAESALLVERKLDGKFVKWNGNNGYVRQSHTPVRNTGKRRQTMLRIPEEDDEVEIIDVDALQDDECIFVTPSEVAQAFSHFSFYHSEKKMILCDLQGEYDRKENMFCFTDPVVHYYDRQNPGKRCLYGRTDLGRKGIETFLDNHECNRLCELVTRGFRSACDTKRQRQN